ncbi:hypothetical protein N9Z85_06585 [Akkermansiaceae bacterium]|nr:hypothetical protein [Akkermansiaceae bacterium]
MSDYTKATNFAGKDALSSGDPQKIIKGSEIDAEYNAIAAAISSKADLNGPTFTGTPSGPTASTGTSSTQLATTAFVQSALVGAYPVGSIYMNATVATNPATLLGFGTWVAFGAGKVPVGLNAGDADFDTVEETGGTKDAIVPTHTHTASSTSTDAGHTHTYVRSNTTTIASGNALPLNYLYTTGTTNTGYANITTNTTVDNAGESATGKNLQPYIVVYMWKRTL